MELGDLLDHCDDLLLIATEGDEGLLRTLKRARPKSVWLAATMPQSGADARRLVIRSPEMKALPYVPIAQLFKELAVRFASLELTVLNGTASEVAEHVAQQRARGATSN